MAFLKLYPCGVDPSPKSICPRGAVGGVHDVPRNKIIYSRTYTPVGWAHVGTWTKSPMDRSLWGVIGVQGIPKIKFNGNYTPVGLTQVRYNWGTVYPYIKSSFLKLYPCGANTCVVVIGVQGIPKSSQISQGTGHPWSHITSLLKIPRWGWPTCGCKGSTGYSWS